MPPTHKSSPSTGSARASVSLSRPALILLGVALILLAFNLRLVFPSLSVLLPEIIRQTGLSSASAGYLTTLPVLCLGLFAPVAPLCARYFGIERTLLGALVLLAAGTALRGLYGIPGLFLGSAMAGGGIAIANVLLPALVKRDFPRHVAGMTGLYTMTLNGGAAVAAAVTLPLAYAFGGSWSIGLGAWALPPIAAALFWVTQLRRKAPQATTHAVQRVRGLWGDPLAWQVTFFMGLQSAMAYCVAGWLAPILQGRGLDGTTAGLVTSVCILTSIVGCLGVPILIARVRDQRLLSVILSILTGAPLLGLLFAPLSTVWVWAMLQGLGQGSMFTAALTVIVLRSPDSLVAAQLSGMAQTVGYILASVGPLLVGLLHGWTGGFAASGWLFVALIAGGCVSGWGAGRSQYVNTPGHPAPPVPLPVNDAPQNNHPL